MMNELRALESGIKVYTVENNSYEETPIASADMAAFPADHQDGLRILQQTAQRHAGEFLLAEHVEYNAEDI